MLRRAPASFLLLLAALSPAGCSCGHTGTTSGTGQTAGAGATSGTGASSTSGAPAGSLALVPASQTLVLTSTTPQTASFSLQLNGVDVTADSVVFDRPDLATIASGEPILVTAPSSAGLYGGTGTVQAVYQGLTATATLTVQVQLSDYGNGLGPTSPSVVALSGSGLPPDTAPGISPLLYPYDRTVWPLGLTSPLLMWNAPQVNDVYRLHYAETFYTFDGYYTLTSLPAQMRLDQGDWDRITASNNAATAPDPLTFTLSRWDSVGQMAYQTAQETWSIAPASLRGAIYYWTVSSDGGTEDGHITRFQPGTGAQPQILNSGLCMGCHAVNAQGTTMVADIDDPSAPADAPYGSGTGTRAWAAFSLADAEDAGATETLLTTKYGADLAINPDGTYVVFGGPTPSNGGTLGSPPVAGSKYISLGEVATGNVVATSGLDSVDVASGMGLMMPAFSPDGTKLAVIEAQFYADNVLPNAANAAQVVAEYIATLDFDESGPMFAPTLDQIVTGTDPAFADGGGGLAYPSFTPDSQAVAFNAGPTTTGCASSCDDFEVDNGDLWMVSADGGAPVRLATLDDPPNPADWFSSVEPTFNPQQRGGYAWVVFTSMRNWGNMPWPAEITTTQPVNGKRRLWAAAIDPALGTVDPSHPPFYLEGQEDRPNMRGFWTLAPCLASANLDGPNSTPDGGAACTNGFECCSGFCINGQCANVGQVACAGVGGSCLTSVDCCNSPAIQCSQGSCAPHFE